MFQSPRSGKFVSDTMVTALRNGRAGCHCFNPLDRGNLYQMSQKDAFSRANDIMFQSPRSGKFVSDNTRR